MKRWIKPAARALGWTIGALVAGALVLHVFLAIRLNHLLRNVVFPRVAEAYGVQVTADDAYLSFLRGRMRLGGLRVANPPGFTEASVFSVARGAADLNWRALAGGVLQIAEVRTEGARITVVHDERNRFNVVELHRNLENATARRRGTTGEPPSPPATDGTRATPGMPRILLRNFSAETTLTYVDRFLPADPITLTFRTLLSADNVTTYESSHPTWGTFTILGHLADDPRSFVADLRGTVAPLTDPARPSFGLSGQITSVDWKRLRPLLRRTDVECDSADARLRLVCRRGAFESPESVISITLRNARPTGRLSRKLKGWPLPRDITVAVPVRGELGDPKLDLQGAIFRSVVESVAGNADEFLRALNVDPKAADDWGRALKVIGESLLSPSQPRTNAVSLPSPARP
jgi:hypothetical protein